VIVISRSVERDVVERLRVPAERVVVVYPGFGMRAPPTITAAVELRRRLGLGDDRIVLCVSAALAHKNIPRLIEAFAVLTERQPDARLVVVGHPGRELEGLERLAREAGVHHRLVMTGWISDADLEGLYRTAACCVYPSLHEGFGMPVLEAMARDVPLACSSATSLPEVAGDAAELFDPHDVSAIALAIERLLRDPDRRAELIALGRERVGLFTWEHCADQVIAVYQSEMGPG
jgi:glycosyltransferase involved in cell wall biosynthesis